MITYSLPKEATEFIIKFDSFKDVLPFSFELDNLYTEFEW